MKPLFRHNEKLIDLDMFLDEQEEFLEFQQLTGDELEDANLYDSLGG